MQKFATIIVIKQCRLKEFSGRLDEKTRLIADINMRKPVFFFGRQTKDVILSGCKNGEIFCIKNVDAIPHTRSEGLVALF